MTCLHEDLRVIARDLSDGAVLNVIKNHFTVGTWRDYNAKRPGDHTWAAFAAYKTAVRQEARKRGLAWKWELTF